MQSDVQRVIPTLQNKEHRPPVKIKIMAVLLFICVVLLGINVSCGNFAFDRPSESAIYDVVEGDNKFALDLYRKLTGGDTTLDNLFFSPFSITLAMAMTLLGAREETADQIVQALHLADIDNTGLHSVMGFIQHDLKSAEGDNFELNVANRLFAQSGAGIRAKFLSGTKHYYGGEAKEVDFESNSEEARKTINAWVEKETANRIQDLLQAGTVDARTRLVLVNAIYFKGNWANQFDNVETHTANFHLLSAETKQVHMMYKLSSFKVGRIDELGVKVLELPYAGHKLTMVIFLPNEIDGLSTLRSKLKSSHFSPENQQLVKHKKVHVYLPRFKLIKEVDLKQVLTSMGIKDLFDENNADLSGIAGRQGELHVSAVIHKAFIQVDEEGSEAAAATAIQIQATSLLISDEDVLRFNVNHPFMFYIRDQRSGSVLFMGCVTNPPGVEDQHHEL